MEKKDTKKIIIDVTPDLHSRIKIFCAMNDISIKEWVSQAILKQMYENDSKNMQKMR